MKKVIMSVVIATTMLISASAMAYDWGPSYWCGSTGQTCHVEAVALTPPGASSVFPMMYLAIVLDAPEMKHGCTTLYMRVGHEVENVEQLKSFEAFYLTALTTGLPLTYLQVSDNILLADGDGLCAVRIVKQEKQ